MNVQFPCRICAAPLEAETNERFVRCTKCGATSPVPNAPIASDNSNNSGLSETVEFSRSARELPEVDPIRDDVRVPCAGFRPNPFAFTADLDAPTPADAGSSTGNADSERVVFVKFGQRDKTGESTLETDVPQASDAFPNSPSVDDLIAPFLEENG